MPTLPFQLLIAFKKGCDEEKSTLSASSGVFAGFKFFRKVIFSGDNRLFTLFAVSIYKQDRVFSMYPQASQMR